MDDSTIVGVILFWIVIGGGIGAAIGANKGRQGAGAALGALLGPVGWILAAVALDYPHKCPACLGGVPEGAKACQHCGRELPCIMVKTQSGYDWRDASETTEARIVCPVCGTESWVEPENLSKGVKCAECGIGFVPTPTKQKP